MATLYICFSPAAMTSVICSNTTVLSFILTKRNGEQLSIITVVLIFKALFVVQQICYFLLLSGKIVILHPQARPGSFSFIKQGDAILRNGLISTEEFFGGLTKTQLYSFIFVWSVNGVLYTYNTYTSNSGGISGRNNFA